MKPKYLILTIIWIYCALGGERDDKVIDKLSLNKKFIELAASTIGISPRIISSVIYTEQTKNYNWKDGLFDNAMAKSGYNSSLGLSQIKVNTAFWIERELNNQNEIYYLGKRIQQLFKPSQNRDEIIERLTNDSSNILYCAVYLEMIKKRWMDCGYTFTQENEAGMLGSLYSLGIIKSNGLERLPKPDSHMNDFGKTAQEFYDSFVTLN